MKRYRSDQSREGVARRRKLEFDAVRDQLARRRAQFMARLKRRLEERDGCMCYRGTLDHKGYARLSVKFEGKHLSIHAHRLFLILKLGRPIRRGYEAAHSCGVRPCVKHVSEVHYKINAVSA